MAKKFKTLEQFKKDSEIGGSQKKLQDIMKVYAFPQPDAPENTFVKGKHYGFPLQGKKSLPYRSKGYNTDKPFGENRINRLKMNLQLLLKNLKMNQIQLIEKLHLPD